MPNYPRSYYAASARAPAPQPSLAGRVSADVVVVGAGFTGLSAALHAAEAGYRVVVLEARRIGWGASGRSGGQMIPGLRWAATRLVRQFGETLARRLLLLANEANAMVRRRIERHDIACDLRDGHFLAAARPAHYRAMEEEAEALSRLISYPSLRPVAAADVRDHVDSEAYHGGLYDAAGGHLHPLNYALGLAAAAIAAGVTIYEESPVLSVDHAGPVVATTAAGAVEAQFGVMAADVDMGTLVPAARQMTMPVANYNIATAPMAQARAAALLPSGAAVADSRFVLNYFRLSADNRLIFGGGERYSAREPDDIAAFVRPYMEAVFPQLAGIPIDYGWGGMVGVSLNRLPQFGRIGQSFYAHGWSGHGVLLTTLAGALIAEAMRGTAERFDLFAHLPHRPFPGGPWLRHPLYVAGMLYFALRDRL